MVNKFRLLLAVGDEHICNILKKHITNSDFFHIIDQDVMHFSFLDEVVETEKPDILIVHDYFLPSNTVDKADREKEWLQYFHYARQRYNDLRIVFLCERSKDDIFLNKIIGLGIQDIFNESSIDMNLFINQLSNPPRYTNVAMFRVSQTSTALNFDNTVVEKDYENKSTNNKLETDRKNEDKNFTRKDKEKEHTQKIKKVVVNKTVERLVSYPFMKKLILIGSPFPNSGSTFVSHLIAKEIAKLGLTVSYIENPFQQAYSYDRFDGNKKTVNYRSIFHTYMPDKIPEDTVTYNWKVDGVDMVVKHPTDEAIYTEDQIDFEVFMKVIMANDSAVAIIDVGQDWDKEVYKSLFEIANNAVVIIEPDISKIHYLEDPNNKKSISYRDITNSAKTILIGNKFDASLLTNNIIKDLYADKLYTTIPDFPSKDIFNSQEIACFFNTYKDYDINIEEIINPILELLIPDDLLDKKRKRKHSLFHNLFNKNIGL